MDYIAIWVVIINLMGLLLMWSDKQRARKNKWRIPEKTLFAAAFLGGSLGTLLGMYLFRHKTRHHAFVIGIPVILMMQIAAFCFIIRIR